MGNLSLPPMDEGTKKAPIPKCRLYWCFCLDWRSNFVGSQSGQKQSVKRLQNWSTTQLNIPPIYLTKISWNGWHVVYLLQMSSKTKPIAVHFLPDYGVVANHSLQWSLKNKLFLLKLCRGQKQPNYNFICWQDQIVIKK